MEVTLKTLKHFILFSEYILFPKSFDSKIIYYHDINNDLKHRPYTNMATSFQVFKEHIQIIRDCGFHIVKTITENDHQVMIGLDDGWAGIYDVKDYLIEQDIFPTISIAPALVGLEGYLTWNQIIELKQLGFNFVCHSWLHQSLTLYNNNNEELNREILRSRDVIHDMIGSCPNIFCYPQGVFSKEIYEKTLAAGYDEIWSVVDGNYYDEVFPKVKRRCLVQECNPNELKWILYGANRFLGKKHFRSSYFK